MAKEPILETRELVFAYRPGLNIIDHLNISLYQGETVFLSGDNGAGKTTLGKLLIGILKPEAGQCLLLGKEVSAMPLYRVGQKVGYCFQNPGKQLFAVTVEEELAFGLKYRGVSSERIMAMTEYLLEIFDIQHLRKSFPHNLSWGEKRRVALAACLALEPEYLILDEPAAGLDENRLNTLAMTIRRLGDQGIGMLIISHNQSFMRENAQRILVMKKGRITDEYEV